MPLAEERDGGETLRETLRAYFATGHNASSAAAALGVRRHTVASRLRAIEERLKRTLSSCAAALELALRLEELNGFPSHEPNDYNPVG
jgi:DNA-binding PucR family transcriptional regulator